MPDAQHHSEDEMAVALNQALAAGDACQLMDTLGRMARAHRMRRVAQQTGLGEKSLHKSMPAGARPEAGAVIRVLRALGYRLQAVPLSGGERRTRMEVPHDQYRETTWASQ